MRVLVTGSTGFIGKELCSALSRHQHQVFVAKKENQLMSQLIDSTHDTGSTYSILEESKIEVVIHLAAKTPLKTSSSSEESEEYYKSNLLATQDLALLCESRKVKRFIFMSSIKVLGEGKESPYSMDDDAKPYDDYAKSKWQAEQFLLKMRATSNMEIVILRSPLVYGPGVKGNFLKLIHLVEMGIPFPFGSIRNRRSMIFVGNLVNAIEVCITHPNASGKTYLVSDGKDISTSEIIKNIAKALKRRPRLLPIPVLLLKFIGTIFGKKEAMRRLVGSLSLDIEAIKKDLNWNPPFTLEEGMTRTIEWYLSKK